jgi:hypothetical protein
MSGDYTATIYGQHDPKDAADVARREAEAAGFRVLGVGSKLPHRGVIVGTWIVTLKVERK